MDNQREYFFDINLKELNWVPFERNIDLKIQAHCLKCVSLQPVQILKTQEKKTTGEADFLKITLRRRERL